MKYQFSWIEEPYLLFLTMEGETNLPDYEAMITEQLRYYDGANGRLYLVADVSKLGGGRIDPKVMDALFKSPTFKHANNGLIVLIGTAALLRFVMTMVNQNPEKLTKESGPIRIFDNMDEAVQFAKDVAAADQRRGTACVLKAETPPPAQAQ